MSKNSGFKTCGINNPPDFLRKQFCGFAVGRTGKTAGTVAMYHVLNESDIVAFRYIRYCLSGSIGVI